MASAPPAPARAQPATHARSVAGAVSAALGSTTSAACELGCTVVIPVLGSAVSAAGEKKSVLIRKAVFAPHGNVRVLMRALSKGLEKWRWSKRYG